RSHRRGRPRPRGRPGQCRRAARAGRDGQPRGRSRPAHRIGRRTAGMSALLIVWKKELIEFVRDRRTFALTLLFGPLLAPLLFMGLTTRGESKAREQMEKPLEVAIVGADHAPNLVSWLAGQGIERKEVADPEAAVRAQEDDAYLSIDAGFAEDWRAGRPAVVEIVHDSTRRDSGIPVRRLERALELYGQQMGALRLLARGI